MKETTEQYLARGGVITQCPSPDFEALRRDTLRPIPERPALSEKECKIAKGCFK